MYLESFWSYHVNKMMETDRQMDGWRNRQMDGQTDIQTDRRMHRQTDRQTDRQTQMIISLQRERLKGKNVIFAAIRHLGPVKSLRSLNSEHAMEGAIKK